MTDCACGHSHAEHQDGTGRCQGHSHDYQYGTFKCLCPYYTEEKL